MANNLGPTKAEVKRIIGALKRTNKKVVSLEVLSRLVGIYPDIIADVLAYFEPMIRMDPSINCKDLLPDLEKYVEAPLTPNKPKEKRVVVKSSEVSEFASFSDFVYRKMTSVGGLIDPSYVLTEKDIKILEKLLKEEKARRKSKKKK